MLIPKTTQNDNIQVDPALCQWFFYTFRIFEQLDIILLEIDRLYNVWRACLIFSFSSKRTTEKINEQEAKYAEEKDKYDEQNEMISFVMKIPKIGSNIGTIYINTPDNVEGKCYWFLDKMSLFG